MYTVCSYHGDYLAGQVNFTRDPHVATVFATRLAAELKAAELTKSEGRQFMWHVTPDLKRCR